MTRLQPGREDGAAAVELALLLPVLLVAAVAFLPLVQRMLELNTLDNAMGEAIRYATKALPVAYDNADAPECPAQRRRRSAAEIAGFLDRATDGRVPAADVTVTVEVPNDGPVVSDPCRAIAGSLVTITADVTADTGILGDIARTVLNLPFISDSSGTAPDDSGLSEQLTLTASAVLE